uniref:Uncharacterized protein n=1 Tax=Quercus lobata TaxID=97700 RepID=A0A7N2N8G4_QUELO
MVYHIWLRRNASTNQGRLFSKEAMVKMIKWEVKNRVESFTGQLKADWKTYKGCMAQGNFDYINSYYGDSDCKDSKEGGLGLDFFLMNDISVFDVMR